MNFQFSKVLIIAFFDICNCSKYPVKNAHIEKKYIFGIRRNKPAKNTINIYFFLAVVKLLTI